MGAATAASRALGGVRVLVVAAVLGTTFLGNTFEAANTLPTVLFELLAAGALSAVLVPSFSTRFDRGYQASVERLAGGLLGVALVVLGAVAIVGVVGAPWLAAVLTSASPDPVIEADQRELATFLLRFFMPQVAIYAVGFLAIAVLNARRVFSLPAAAPIANTVVVVGAMVLFRHLAGSDPGLDLAMPEKVTLGLGGTLGVMAFVAVPTIALGRSGFRLRPRAAFGDTEVRSLLGLSAWAVLQHGAAAVLLGTALVLANAVEGGVVAYRVAFFVFLGVYAVLSQPIQTAVLPELAAWVDRGDPDGFGRTVRWALDRMALLVLPAAAALVSMSLPIAHIIAFGAATRSGGPELIAAGIASLGLGVISYGAFLLLARAWYALGDSRTPAIVSLAVAIVGIGAMVAVAPAASGSGRIFLLGLSQSVVFTLGAVALAVGLWRRTASIVVSRTTAIAACMSAMAGFVAWLVVDAVDPAGRLASLVTVSLVVVVLGGAYALIVRRVDPADGPEAGTAA